MGSCPRLTSPRPPQHMREAAERRQQLELEHEQALAALKAKQQEIDLLQKVRGAGCSLGGGLGGRGCCGLAAHPGFGHTPERLPPFLARKTRVLCAPPRAVWLPLSGPTSMSRAAGECGKPWCPLLARLQGSGHSRGRCFRLGRRLEPTAHAQFDPAAFPPGARLQERQDPAPRDSGFCSAVWGRGGSWINFIARRRPWLCQSRWVHVQTRVMQSTGVVLACLFSWEVTPCVTKGAKQVSGQYL